MQNRLGVIFIKRKQLIIFILAFVVVFLGMNYFKLSDNFSGNKKYVYVLGNVVGIRANTEGVLVLGYEDNIQYIDKLKEGDNILYINDEKVNSSQDVYDILNKLKKNIVNIKFERSGKIRVVTEAAQPGYLLVAVASGAQQLLRLFDPVGAQIIGKADVQVFAEQAAEIRRADADELRDGAL